MPRYRLTIEYDGTPFVGWQRQANGRSIQQALEEAAERFSGERVRIGGAGRTDAGVHAEAQVAHVDFARAWPGATVRDALNAQLRLEPVSVLAAEPAPANFDARFAAVRRRYLYRILNRRAPPALERHRVWHVARPLDAEAMHEAAQALIGLHDFTTFRAAECQARSPLRTLDRLYVRRAHDLVLVAAEVRSMVGSLKLVGEGRWQARDLSRALEARDRRACGPVAPPDGLYLVGVDYPDSGRREPGEDLDHD